MAGEIRARIALEGSDVVKRQLQDIEQTGSRAFKTIQSAGKAVNFGGGPAAEQLKKIGLHTIEAESGTTRIREAIHVLHPLLDAAGLGIGNLGAYARLASVGLGGLAAVMAGAVLIGLEKIADGAARAKGELSGLLPGAAGEEVWRTLSGQAERQGTTPGELTGGVEALVRARSQERLAAGPFSALQPQSTAADFAAAQESLINGVRSGTVPIEDATKATATFFETFSKEGLAKALDGIDKVAPQLSDRLSQALLRTPDRFGLFSQFQQAYRVGQFPQGVRPTDILKEGLTQPGQIPVDVDTLVKALVQLRDAHAQAAQEVQKNTPLLTDSVTKIKSAFERAAEAMSAGPLARALNLLTEGADKAAEALKLIEKSAPPDLKVGVGASLISKLVGPTSPQELEKLTTPKERKQLAALPVETLRQGGLPEETIKSLKGKDYTIPPADRRPQISAPSAGVVGGVEQAKRLEELKPQDITALAGQLPKTGYSDELLHRGIGYGAQEWLRSAGQTVQQQKTFDETQNKDQAEQKAKAQNQAIIQQALRYTPWKVEKAFDKPLEGGVQARDSKIVGYYIDGKYIPNPTDEGPNLSAEPAPGHANGGIIRGPGTGTSDSILMQLAPGGFVLNAKANDHVERSLNVSRHEEIIKQLSGYADGGQVLSRVSNKERYFSPTETNRIGLPNLNAINALGLADGGSVDDSDAEKKRKEKAAKERGFGPGYFVPGSAQYETALEADRVQTALASAVGKERLEKIKEAVGEARAEKTQQREQQRWRTARLGNHSAGDVSAAIGRVFGASPIDASPDFTPGTGLDLRNVFQYRDGGAVGRDISSLLSTGITLPKIDARYDIGGPIIPDLGMPDFDAFRPSRSTAPPALPRESTSANAGGTHNVNIQVNGQSIARGRGDDALIDALHRSAVNHRIGRAGVDHVSGY